MQITYTFHICCKLNKSEYFLRLIYLNKAIFWGKFTNFETLEF